MIDYFALALTHGLIALAVIRIMSNDSVDREAEPGAPTPKPKPKRERRPNA